jgi:hypothetical protein
MRAKAMGIPDPIKHKPWANRPGSCFYRPPLDIFVCLYDSEHAY